MAEPVKRCAVYTRKSSEEGLEQAFNSLDAQREACVAYIASQKHEGWVLSPEMYDDGGYSGGNMQRPGLVALMAEVEAGRIQVIVVYKVDRLTRSLSDFARIVDVLDARGASFVSVTQSFNTTTSMGRLTLNVLLSFAQFEREVTGERIRDKVAASKRKGMWMGGPVPLGYRVAERRLVIDETEAATVRHAFTRYVALRSLADLVDELAAAGIRTRLRSYRDGRTVGGVAFSKGPLAWLLANRVYIGEVGHKGQVYAGEHDAIVDRELWDAVQAIAADNRVTRRLGSKAKAPSLLTGLIVDRNARPMSPTYAVREARRYRYYATRPTVGGRAAKSEIVRLPAHAIETLVITQLVEWLDEDGIDADTGDLTAYRDRRAQRGAIADRFRTGSQLEQRAALLELGVTVAVGDEQVEIVIIGNGSTVEAATIVIPHQRYDPRADPRFAIAGDGGPAIARPDAALLKLIVLGFAAREAAISGNPEPLVDHYSRQHQTRLARLSYLAPDIVGAIVAGHQPATLSGRRLLRIAELPLAWPAQRTALGFA
nr:recombinase family protein [Polymorphobacter sp.]